MKLKDNWTLTELDDEYVAVPMQDGKKSFSGIVKLNETGKDIWDGLAEGLSEDEIADRLVDMYKDLDRDRAMKAVIGVIEKLREGGLLAD